MKEVLDTHIRNQFPTDKVVERLISLGYKAEENYGISRARIYSNCPQDIADDVIDNVFEDHVDELVKLYTRGRST
tara:strand:- start:3514 stop:3738 length:225 start_codon:yes stop_codon:yes gene_type:complete